ncbi:hypothetical protein SGQ44_08660 [Flavobacterium sp. Fl-77]|uniref:Uncharacterized protein n=1 Tax=Flavobacterium flavipigmentatum TaxID=2893884 RepID=A0AAJ2SB14_9FLAO|nr:MULTISPECIES: hypothetical protein [unclassified Flavobacterium]MDX6182263.1 hypothetical protein [Flavobacterium sp. Fl-33]MDX6185824.1 hypothetical protein [Flavobacterium sp. Fl-77]UFH39004.1 hypothetical protein LNP22_01710 [Flavobacterium sp. F-70]
MKNFFSNFFGRNHNPESIVSFDVLNSIYTYLYEEVNQFEFKMKGIHDTVAVNLYSFPTAFDYEEARNEMEKSGFKNAYEVLNELYKKINIGPLSADQIEQGLEYDYIHIQFYSAPTPEMKQYVKHVLHNFIIFFCCTNSLETNDFRVLYSNSYFLNYTRALLETEPITVNEPKNDIQKIGFKELERVLQGMSQYLEIELPEGIVLSSQENLLPEIIEVTQETFQEFIRLVSRGNIEEKLLKKLSKKLLKNSTKEYYEMVEGHFDFFESIDCWNSDWKFDPEDAEYFISEMIGKALNFEYPEETYSHDLFPYIQSALGKYDLELMTYDTHGDNYLFFVANKKDVNRILELSELTKIEVNQL